MRIIRNPLIICGCGSSIFSILGVVGYVIYLPKYFEHEFRISKSKAGLFSGSMHNIDSISTIKWIKVRKKFRWVPGIEPGTTRIVGKRSTNWAVT